jgi:CheY-like chemotaxis protein
MPEGGVLTVRARNIAAPGLPASLEAGEYVSISVRDTGDGMSPEVLARATEPFFTTKPPGKGTGLGLAMAQGFAEQSGGCLRIKSELSAGTTVEIVLPRARLTQLASVESLQNANARASRALDPALHGEAVLLLVEDDDQVRPVTAAFLRELGYTVIEAASAEAASVMVHTLETLDLLVTDVAMSGADGPTLAAQLRAERPDLPVLFVSGHPPGPALVGECVLRKPFSAEALGATLLERLGRSGPAQGGWAGPFPLRLRTAAAREESAHTAPDR